jgi:hypothetical protein
LPERVGDCWGNVEVKGLARILKAPAAALFFRYSSDGLMTLESLPELLEQDLRVWIVLVETAWQLDHDIQVEVLVASGADGGLSPHGPLRIYLHVSLLQTKPSSNSVAETLVSSFSISAHGLWQFQAA